MTAPASIQTQLTNLHLDEAHEHTGSQNQGDSTISKTVANSASDLTQALQEAAGSSLLALDVLADPEEFDSSKNKVNTVLGQSKGILPQQLDDAIFHVQVEQHVVVPNENERPALVEKFLPLDARAKIFVQSNLPEQVQYRVGLLNSPSIVFTSTKENSAYNLSMVREALTLGFHLRQQIKSNCTPTLASLWVACREWRASRLDVRTKERERSFFSGPREHPPAMRNSAITFADRGSTRYEFLLEVIANQVKNLGPIPLAGEGSPTGKALKRCNLASDGNEGQRISLQHSVIVDGKDIPLTELRSFINKDGEAIENSWSHNRNCMRPITDTELEIVPEDMIGEMVMIHTQQPHLQTLLTQLERQFKAYSSFLKQEKGGACLESKVETLRSDDANSQAILKQVASMHYILAHAMFDMRGSAAKSELFARMLSACAGIELPPFKAGFVPDLEAFLNSQEDFVQNYSKSFDF